MTILSRNFYLFLGFHSFLLGLFPFFLPVYLFKNGSSLAEISWFIALTGIGFCLSLWFFDKHRSSSCLWPVILSFILEIILLVLLLAGAPFVLVGLVNGGYSGLFWTLQRILFLAGGEEGKTTVTGSGRRFGNFQIYVLVVLKSGIFAGGLLLDIVGGWAVLLLSLLLGSVAVALFSHFSGQSGQVDFPQELQQQKPLSFRDIYSFSDPCRSRLVFAVDGIFLYLESYFWVISIFLIAKESFTRLGLVVIGLAVILGGVFYLLKNRIDRLNSQLVYSLAVGFYIFSWVLRGTLSETMALSLQLCLLLLVAFCTSFFRLAFNKRFFDLAKRGSMYHYIFVKSYYSQAFLALGFALVGGLLYSITGEEGFLRDCYWLAALLGGVYWCYLAGDSSGSRD